MSEIHNVKLEILRPGPAHNQLLSPLTPYLVLCGADGPVTVNLPFEQRQLLIRLERLRYEVGGKAIPPSQREAELRELGEAIGRLFGQIPALLSELGSVRAERGKLVHLRLALSAFELSLLPFEAAIAPDGFPGSGSPLFLQSSTPIALTREVRRGRPLPVLWNRPPRILFAFATPAGLPPVPADRHLLALRRAIDPWVRIKDSETARVVEVKKILTVLPEATLEQIRQCCKDEEFTHVHILAHGFPYDHAGDRHFGLALVDDRKPGTVDVVDGERLAIALTTDHAAKCGGRRRPTVISLATCDSGDPGSVLTPGGSIAHSLHAAGIPFVFASQFPLWMRASTIFTEVLYKRLLAGADPRCVLHELRQRLRTACPETHDWASIVAYATVPWDFETQVHEFRDRQTRKRIETKFERIDDLLTDHVRDSGASLAEATANELKGLCASIRKAHKDWRETPEARVSGLEGAERLGVSAASEKRIGIAYERIGMATESLDAYRQSLVFYRQAIAADTRNHWVITQYLSMVAVVRLIEGGDPATLADDYGQVWTTARQISQWRLTAVERKERAWANSTLAELYLLGTVYGGAKFDREQAATEISRLGREIVEICGPDSFPVQSTARQFRRYIENWQWPAWGELACKALTALGEDISRLDSGVGGEAPLAEDIPPPDAGGEVPRGEIA